MSQWHAKRGGKLSVYSAIIVLSGTFGCVNVGVQSGDLENEQIE